MCGGPLLGLYFWTTVGVEICYGGEESSIDFFAFIIVFIHFPLRWFYCEIAFYTLFVLSYSIFASAHSHYTLYYFMHM